MKRIILLVFLVFSVSCGGRGIYLYETREDPRGGPDRPWLIIGAKGAGSKQLEKRLCQGKELRVILGEARLALASQERLFEAACGPKASAEKFLEIYYQLPAPQRQAVKRAFERHGYTLNDYGC